METTPEAARPTFDDDAMPDDVLEALAAIHLGTVVKHNVTERGVPFTPMPGFTVLRLFCGEAPILSVTESGHSWPIVVHHHHFDHENFVETKYNHCGENYIPGVRREDMSHLGDKAKLAKLHALATEHGLEKVVDHIDTAVKQATDTPIDTPQKLFDLCEKLLAGDKTAEVKKKVQWSEKRAERMKAAKPQ